MVKTVEKGFFYKGDTQGIFRSEFADMQAGTLLRFFFKGKYWFLSSDGIDFVVKEFSKSPKPDKISVPSSMFIPESRTGGKSLVDRVEDLDDFKPNIASELLRRVFDPQALEINPHASVLQDDTEDLDDVPELDDPKEVASYFTQEEFDAVVQKRIEVIKKSLVTKGEEYANRTIAKDRLHNFKRGAAISGKKTTNVLFGYWLKHITSVIDMVDQIDAGELPTEALVEEKIMDNINYLILLDAAIADLRKPK